MKSQLKTAVLATLVFTLVTGVAYPLLVTGLAQLLFPHQANGSLVTVAGRTVGSELLGQGFSGDGYFWSRPSATSPPWNAAASSGANLGPTNPDFLASVAARVQALREAHPQATGAIPVDLATASASGLDPDLSPAAALFQVERVAAARGLDAAVVRDLVERQVTPRQLGFLGEPRVNVLRLNLTLDTLAAAHRSPGGG